MAGNIARFPKGEITKTEKHLNHQAIQAVAMTTSQKKDFPAFQSGKFVDFLSVMEFYALFFLLLIDPPGTKESIDMTQNHFVYTRRTKKPEIIASFEC